MGKTILRRTTIMVIAFLVVTVVLLGVARNTVVSHIEDHEIEHEHTQGE